MSITIISILSDEEAKEKQKENQQRILNNINKLLENNNIEKAILNEFNNIELKIKDRQIYLYPSNYDINLYELQFDDIEFEKEYFKDFEDNLASYKLTSYQVIGIITDLMLFQ